MDKKKIGALVGVVGVTGAVVAGQFINMDHSKAEYMTRNLVQEYEQKQQKLMNEVSSENQVVYDKANKVEYVLTSKNTKTESSSKDEVLPEESVSKEISSESKEVSAPVSSSSVKESAPVATQEEEQPASEEVVVEEDKETSQQIIEINGVVESDSLVIRKEPSEDAEEIGTFAKGDVVRGTKDGDWILFEKEDGTTGYVFAGGVKEVEESVIEGLNTGDSTLPKPEKKEEKKESSEQPKEESKPEEKEQQSSEKEQPKEESKEEESSEPVEAPKEEVKEITLYAKTDSIIRQQKSLDSRIVRVVPLGTELKGVMDGDWLKLSDGTGYVLASILVDVKPELPAPTPTPAPAPQAPVTLPEGKPYKGTVISSANVRKGSGLEYDVIGGLDVGDVVEGVYSDGWVAFNYNGKVGYISGILLSTNVLDPEAPKPVTTPTAPPEEDETVPPVDNSKDVISQIVDGAYSQLGKPYIWGSNNPAVGFDCSGLCYWLYEQYAGVTLNRDSKSMFYNGYSVSWDQLQPGDLLFFDTLGDGISHVGIYVGDGYMIHACDPSTGVIKTEISGWQHSFIGAKRILN